MALTHALVPTDLSEPALRHAIAEATVQLSEREGGGD